MVESHLYDQANVSKDEFLLSFYAIKLKHSLSDSAANEILKLIKLILPTKNEKY